VRKEVDAAGLDHRPCLTVTGFSPADAMSQHMSGMRK
jgi:hypothetical protein